MQTASTVGNNNKDYVIVTALKYDKDGNLWGFNSISPSTSLFAYTKDKEWVSHHKSEFMYSENKSLENVNNIIEDSRRLLWFGNNHWDFHTYIVINHLQMLQNVTKIHESRWNRSICRLRKSYCRRQ